MEELLKTKLRHQHLRWCRDLLITRVTRITKSHLDRRLNKLIHETQATFFQLESDTKHKPAPQLTTVLIESSSCGNRKLLFNNSAMEISQSDVATFGILATPEVEYERIITVLQRKPLTNMRFMCAYVISLHLRVITCKYNNMSDELLNYHSKR